MWPEDESEDDSSGQFYPDEVAGAEPSFGEEIPAADEFTADDEAGQPPRDQQAGQFGSTFPPHGLPKAALPNVVPVMNLYEAARLRAVADQQLSKLFNPEYYI